MKSAPCEDQATQSVQPGEWLAVAGAAEAKLRLIEPHLRSHPQRLVKPMRAAINSASPDVKAFSSDLRPISTPPAERPQILEH
jgi:hypothetical protein